MSTLQAEIRDGIYGLLKPYIIDNPWKAEVIFILTDKILKFLDSKQVAIIRIPQRGEDKTGSVLCFLEELIECED